MSAKKLTNAEISAYEALAAAAKRLRELRRWAEASEIDLAAAVRRLREAQRRAMGLPQRRRGGRCVD